MVQIKKLLILILLILSALCVSTKSDIGSFQSEEAYTCPDCNVILISIDTLRADHLGTYGYPKDTSPNIDRFAGESVLFENAIVQASWTAPSHMSIMTSLYPTVHKLQEYSSLKKNKAGRIDDSLVTLAQVLKENGYSTASFNGGGFVGKEFGFDRGFDVYDAPSRDKIEITNDAAINWLTQNHGQKFFLFSHTYTTHAPYTPPAFYRYKFFPGYNVGTDRKYMLRGGFFGGKIRGTGKGIEGEELKDDEIWKVVALYDGEINYVDHELGHLFEALDYFNLTDNTIIIFTSDHGEELLDHDNVGHIEAYYQEVLNVPLIIKFPGANPKRIKNLVQSIDIMPTLLDALDITIPFQAQGVSLLPVIRDGKNVNSYAYSEGGLNSQIKTIIDENLTWKYIYNIERKHEELYYLENDHAEQKNLINETPEIARDLREELFRWMDENERLAESYSSSAIELENETKEALRALGYLT